METFNRRVHFPYQHPVFGRTGDPTPRAGVKKSVYYWWWEYLRRSSAYKKALNEGTKNSQLARLLDDFGDIYSCDFKTWWKDDKKGARLFSTLDQKHVTLNELRSDEHGVDYLDITIPLNLPRRHIEHKLKRLLDTHHKGRKGRQNARLQIANYTVTRMSNVTTLETALSVYDLKMENPDLSMWKVAVMAIPKYRHFREHLKDPAFKLDYDLRRQAAVEVHRYLKQVKQSIQNTEQGLFP